MRLPALLAALALAAPSAVAQVPIGTQAPDFEIAEWHNRPATASGDSLADLRGRVVLLKFWRTW